MDVGVRVIVWTGAAEAKVTVTGVWAGADWVGVWTGEGVTGAGMLVTVTGPG